MAREVITLKSGKINDYLHLLDLKEFGMNRVLACFIAEFDDATCILDCGSSLEVKRIWRYLKRKEISFSSVKYLIPSHHHFDHSGGMWKLYNEIKKYNPDVKILTNNKTKDLLNDYHHHLGRARRTYQDFVGVMKPIDDNAFKIIEPSINFNDKPNSLDFIDVFTLNGEEIKLSIVKTPGHTPDHQCSLFVRDNEIDFIYSGEAAGTIYHSSKLITMPTSMPIYFNYKDFMDTLKNLKKLKTPLRIGYTHYGIVSGRENVKYMLNDIESFIQDFRLKVKGYYEEKPETRHVFDKIMPYFRTRSDIGGENDSTMGNILLGVVYGMLLDLGFRKLDNSEQALIDKYKD